MLSCYLAAKMSVICLVTFPGLKEVECIEIGKYSICIDTHYDTECLQDTSEEWIWSYGNGEKIIVDSLVDTLNKSCQ